MSRELPGIVFLAVLAWSACSSPPAAPPPKHLYERIVTVRPADGGRTEVGFERSARSYVIDPARSPDAEAMVAFAEAARAGGKPVHATFDPVSDEPKSAGPGVPAVLLRLADTPDPEAASR